MSSNGYLVLRRAGALWAIEGALVRGVERQGATTAVSTDAGPLLADEVVGLVASLPVHRPGPGVSPFLAPGVAGLGLHAGACVAIVDVVSPPRALQTVPPEPPAPQLAGQPRPRRRARRGTSREGSGDGNT